MRAIAAAAAAALLLVGCSTAAKSDGESSAAPAPSSATTTSANLDAPGAPGQEMEFSGPGTRVRVTMHSVSQAVAGNAPAPQSGGRWAGADVETCVDSADGAFAVAWREWSLSDANNGNFAASSTTYASFPKPAFPLAGESVAVGDCTRGWIVFPVGTDVRVTKVKWKPNAKITAVWNAN